MCDTGPPIFSTAARCELAAAVSWADAGRAPQKSEPFSFGTGTNSEKVFCETVTGLVEVTSSTRSAKLNGCLPQPCAWSTRGMGGRHGEN